MSRLLLAAYPDRIARLGKQGESAFSWPTAGAPGFLPGAVSGKAAILASQVDAGTSGEGLIHQASA